MAEAATGLDIAGFSRFLWRDRFTTSRHHLLRELAATGRVLYVEPAPNLGRAAVALSRGDRQRLALELVRPCADPPVAVTRPRAPQFPLEVLSEWPRLWAREARRQGRVQGRLARRAFSAVPLPGRRAVVAFNSFYPARAAGIIEGLRPDLDVYHCTDAIEELTQTSGRSRGEMLAAAELAAAAAADLVVASAEPLAARLSQANPNTHFLPNGVDLETFAPALADGPEPADLPPRPRVLFVGNVEHGRREVLDSSLLERLARDLPATAFVFIGAVPAGSQASVELGPLPNVYMLGPRPRAELPAYLQAADVCVIPYRCTALTRSIYPLKLHEYLAAGRPVVATDFSRSLDEFREVVDVVPPADFAAAVRALLADGERDAPRRVAHRITVAAANTWQVRAAALLELMHEALAQKGL